MTRTKSVPQVLTLLGMVLGVLLLTALTLTFVQAQGDGASVTIVKGPDQTVARDSDVVFNITITNNNPVTLTSVTVVDPLASDCNEAFDRLLGGETTSYTCMAYGVSDSFTNTIAITGTLMPTGTLVTDTDTAFVRVIDPAIEIAKTANPTAVEPGDMIAYTIVVENIGNSDLTNVVVEDGLAACTLSGPSGGDGDYSVLEPDEVWTYTCSVVAGDEDIENTATVNATDELGGAVSDLAQARVEVVHAGIEISKMPDEQIVTSGSAANFTIVITNTSDVTLTNVTVSDDQARACEETFAQLLAKQHQSYSCAASDVRDGFINSAAVAGTDALLGTTVTDADAAKVRLDETQTCPTDMLAYWKLDESGGTTFEDFYYGHNGQCVPGSCPGSTAGQLNGAQEFDGSDKVDVPVVPGDNSFDWGVDDSFSIEFWMQTDSGSTCTGNEVVIGRVGGAGWWVGCEEGGNAYFFLRDGIGNTASVAGAVVMGGAWHHVVAVRDAAAEAIRIYVDGTLEGSTSTDYTAGFDASAALNIGWFNSGNLHYFDGIMDEVALYNRDLSSEEIEQHYAEGLAGRWYCQNGTPYAPFIVSTPVTEAAAGWPYSYDVQAAGNPAPTYALTTSPDGMTIDPATGLISWTPALGQEGSHPVEVEASNSEGSDSQPFTVVVSEGTICPDDMLAYWKLDETSGPTYEDFYDAHDGQCVAGACPSPTAGYINGGQEFDGSNDRVNVPADAVFDWNVNDSFSIGLWMRTDSGSSCADNEVFIGRRDGAAWWVGCEEGGDAYFYLRDRDGNVAEVGGITVTDGAWHHVMAVRDAAEDKIRIYVDGGLEGSTSVYYTAGFDALTALNIGWLNSGSGHYFDGVMDELALYDRALSAVEVQQHYDNGRTGGAYCVNPVIAINKTANPPVAYVGDTVIYTFSVTNPGDAPLSVTTPSDDKCGSVSPTGGDDDGDSRLDSSETWTYQCSMDLVADTTNEATVLGSHFLGGTVSDTVSLFVDVISPAIALQKAANPEVVYAGEPVTYTYIVANPGNDPLWIGANVSDDRCSPIEFVSGNDNDNDTLDPGEVWTYICSMAVSTDITNTATVTGTDSAGGTWSVTDSVFVDVRDSTLTIVKEVDDDDAAFGFTLTYGGHSEPFSLKNGESRQFTQLASGSYTIAEAVPAGWKLGSIVCDNGISMDAPTTPSVTVDLGARQDVSCSFTNVKASYPVYLPMILRNRH